MKNISSEQKIMIKNINLKKEDFSLQNSQTMSPDSPGYNFLYSDVTKPNENDTRKIVGYVSQSK